MRDILCIDKTDPLFIYPYAIKKDKGCLHEALRLFAENEGGEIYLVRGYYNNQVFVHYYFIAKGSDEGSYALNSWENGYFDFPRLTVSQVKEYGMYCSSFDHKY